MIIKEKILDISTGEETIIEREETANERKDRLESEKLAAEIAEKEMAKAEAKSALLEKLGITEEEAALLLS